MICNRIVVLLALVAEAMGVRFDHEVTDLQRPLRYDDVVAVPQYALAYAPLVWLYETETYMPSDIGTQLVNTHPMINTTSNITTPTLTLDNLSQLNNDDGANGTTVYLAANGDFTSNPPWLNGVTPDTTGKSGNATSCAIIVHDHGGGMVDVFYMYFYAYNRGNVVLFNELGDHVGDWEHNMIRFANGTPEVLWYSEHEFGEAFTYDAVAKIGQRPVTFSANGSHANYATAGSHDHTVPDLIAPNGLIMDYTSNTTLWDPTLNAYFYSVTFRANTTGSSSPTFSALPNPVNADAARAPVDWLYFNGQWGDDQLPSTDPRQKQFLSFYKYTAGPTGPRDKDLNRVLVCEGTTYPCIVRDKLEPGS